MTYSNDDPRSHAAGVAFLYKTGLEIRDRCLEAYDAAAADPDLVADNFDPGDATIDLLGSPSNVLTVLSILEAVGFPGCRIP